METNVLVLVGVGITVDVLAGVDADGTDRFGVRLRTFGKQNPKDRMILAQGETFEAALEEAIGKAQDGRWENLKWDARPWAVRVRTDDRSFYGL